MCGSQQKILIEIIDKRKKNSTKIPFTMYFDVVTQLPLLCLRFFTFYLCATITNMTVCQYVHSNCQPNQCCRWPNSLYKFLFHVIIRRNKIRCIFVNTAQVRRWYGSNSIVNRIEEYPIFPFIQ